MQHAAPCLRMRQTVVRAFETKVGYNSTKASTALPSVVQVPRSSLHSSCATARVEDSMVSVESPYSGEVVSQTRYLSYEEIQYKLAQADEAQRAWCTTELPHRIALMNNFFVLADKHREEIAKSITLEMGKPITQSRAEVSTMISRGKAAVDLAPIALGDSIIETYHNTRLERKDGQKTMPLIEEYSVNLQSRECVGLQGALNTEIHTPNSYQSDETYAFERRIIREPVKVVSVVAPWNYPLITATSTIIPALLSGNAVLLKPSPRTPTSGVLLEKIFLEAGFPQGVMQNMFVTVEDYASQVVPHPNLGFISFVGSVQGGKHLNKTVANTRILPIGLELGGKDSLYVAEDCDLQSAVDTIVEGAFYNSGQSCCAIERVFVHESLYEQVCDMLPDVADAYVRIEDPMNPKTTLGPQALPNSCSSIEEKVNEAVESGAKVLLGGKRLELLSAPKSRFFQPTILANVTSSMRIYTEETFGPVILLMSVTSDEHAIFEANNTKFGLTNSIYTQSFPKALNYAKKVHSGVVFMNRADYIDPYLLWSGNSTDSGTGASHGIFGFHNVTKPKAIHFKVPRNVAVSPKEV